jgi:CheY-like chemotaxis protein
MNAAPPLRVLIVADDVDLQAALDLVLGEDGYESHVAASLEDTLARVSDTPFDLVLADRDMRWHKAVLVLAYILRWHVHPTPVGLLTTQLFPGGLGRRLCLYAADALRRRAPAQPGAKAPGGDDQAVLRGAGGARLDGGAGLVLRRRCPLSAGRLAPHLRAPRAQQGRVSGYLARSPRHYSLVCLADLHLYPRAKGLAAHYLCRWLTPEDTRERLMATAHFHFAGERIARIGIRLGPTTLHAQQRHAGASHAG